MMGGDIEEGVGVEVRGGRDVSADLCVSDESYQDFLEVLSSPSTLSQDPEATRPSRDPPAWTSEGRVPSVQFANAPGKEYNHSLTKDIDSYSSSERAEKANDPHESDQDKTKEDSHDDSHGHGHAGSTHISLLASAIVCFIIYFVFCIVFSSVVWDPLGASLDTNINPPFGVPQGVGINLMGIAVGSAFFSMKSGCKAVIGGPDLLPVVFFAEAGGSVLAYLIKVQEEKYPDGYGCEVYGDHYDDNAHVYEGAPTGEYEFGEDGQTAAYKVGENDADYSRFLGGGGAGDEHGDDPCGARRRRSLAGKETKLEDPELFSQVVPTTLVAMMIGNAVTALVFYGLGKMKNTASVIGCIPSSVVAGFLTCIGYKVIKLAVLVCTGYSFKEKYVHKLGYDHPDTINDPWLPLTIAILYGCLLYGLKRSHIIAAEKLIMGFIITPLVIFFVICAITKTDMDTLRRNNWFLTQARDGKGCYKDCAFTLTKFWQTAEVAYGSGKYVAWAAIPRCIPIFIMGATMTSLDNMLKLTSSEKALGIDLDYNHEMKLGGKATLFSLFLCGSPAYGQTKFNVMNLSIARTANSPLPTMYLGGICFLVFLSGVSGPIINIMPRFLLGGLCVFAGIGFLVENLWEGRKNMNRVSFGIVWVIFLTNFIWEFFVLQNLPKDIQPMVPGLLVVFVLGVVLSTFEFMFAFMHKAKPPEIKSGDVCCSSAIRSEKHDTQLAVMSPWFSCFRVESFVFFGTANTLYQDLKAHLAEQKTSKPKAERTKYLIFDLTEVTGIDSSAKDVFFKVRRLLKDEGISLIWAMGHQKIVRNFNVWGLSGQASGTIHFSTMDLALGYVEDKLLARAHNLSQRWLVNPTVRQIFERQVLANVFNISVRADEKRFSSVRLQPWAKSLDIATGEDFCGDDDDNLYMLYCGEVTIKGRDGNDRIVFTGSFFNIDKLLISIGALPGLPSTLVARATKDTTVLMVSCSQFVKMQKEDGALAQKLLMTLCVQNESNRPGRVRPVARHHRSALSEVHLEKKEMVPRLLKGHDYEISLTDAQKESFKQIFDLICEPGKDEIPMEIFSAYVSKEAKALGSQIQHEQFMRMIGDSGIDEDGDGVLTVDEFLSFLRGLFIADIPSSQVGALREAYDAKVAEASGEPMSESRAQALFASLGFDVKTAGWADVMGVIDADGDGDVDFEEFLTGIGMMKKFYLLSDQLDEAFRGYKEESLQKRRESLPTEPSLARLDSKSGKSVRGFTRGLSVKAFFQGSEGGNSNRSSSDAESDDSGGEVELDAGDLEAFLGIPRDMAEEMVFLADQDEVETVQKEEGSVSADRTIDGEEFQQLLRSWT